MNRTIWIFWAQGWNQAPKIAKSAVSSWQDCNPTWKVCTLDADSALAIFGDAVPEILTRNDLPHEAYSDVLRIELLARFGGVWADATTICANPLDSWLWDHSIEKSFFAFTRPAEDRMIASWFLYALANSYLINNIRDAVRTYWEGRLERDDYFWLHHLFEKTYDSQNCFQKIWDEAPHISAAHRFHFSPNHPRLYAPPSDEDLSLLINEQFYVIKMTRKLDEQPSQASLFEYLQTFRPKL